MNKYLAQYRQQMSRLRRIQREAEKRGYIFPKSPLPHVVKNPTAKTIERLSSITPVKLRSKGYKLSPETGELVRQTQRKQEAERKAQALARSAEINRITSDEIQEYEAQKQAEEARKSERRILEEQVDNAQTLDEILQIFNVQDPDELQHWAYEKYIELQERLIQQNTELSNYAEVDIVEPSEISQREDKWEEPPKGYMQGNGIEKPASFENQILNNVIIEMNSRKNIEVANFLLEALQDEITALDIEYGEGQGETIISNRFKEVDENWQSKLEQIDSSDAGEVRDGSFGILGIIRNGQPSPSENEELERVIYDQFKWKSINKRKRSYFRR